MCFEKGENNITRNWPNTHSEETELQENDYISLIEKLAPNRPTFYITGGEPLLSENIIQIIRTIKKYGLYVSLNTNATLLEERAEELINSGLDKIIISLDGPKEIHNSIRGDTFNKIASGIANINKLKKKKSLTTPILRAQCVISPDNVAHLSNTLATVRSLGLREIRFQHTMFAFSKEEFRIHDFLKSDEYRVNISTCVMPSNILDIKMLKNQIKIIKTQTGKNLLVKFEPEIKSNDLQGYYGDPCHPFVGSCLSPWRRLVVSPSGEMGPCQSIYMGKYPHNSPDDIWNGKAFRKLRRHMLNHGLFPHCNRCCHREYYPPTIDLTVR